MGVATATVICGGSDAGRRGGGARLMGSRSASEAEGPLAWGATGGRTAVGGGTVRPDARGIVGLGGGGGGGIGRLDTIGAGVAALPYHADVPSQALVPGGLEKSQPVIAAAVTPSTASNARLRVAPVCSSFCGMFARPLVPIPQG